VDDWVEVSCTTGPVSLIRDIFCLFVARDVAGSGDDTKGRSGVVLFFCSDPAVVGLLTVCAFSSSLLLRGSASVAGLSSRVGAALPQSFEAICDALAGVVLPLIFGCRGALCQFLGCNPTIRLERATVGAGGDILHEGASLQTPTECLVLLVSEFPQPPSPEHSPSFSRTDAEHAQTRSAGWGP